MDFNNWVPDVVTSDTHIGHKKLAFLRGFERDVDAMDAEIIRLWNEAVPKKARVLMLGDVFLCHPDRAKAVLESLNGEILLLMGNHDKLKFFKSFADRFVGILDYKTFKIGARDVAGEIEVFPFVASHYPMASWDGMYKRAVMLHGHSHGGMDAIPNRYDVGIDIIRYEAGERRYTMRGPYPMAEIVAKVRADRTKEWNRLVSFAGAHFALYKTAHQTYSEFITWLKTQTDRKILSVHLVDDAKYAIAGYSTDNVGEADA